MTLTTSNDDAMRVLLQLEEHGVYLNAWGWQRRRLMAYPASKLTDADRELIWRHWRELYILIRSFENL